jgi:hypothetical protein
MQRYPRRHVTIRLAREWVFNTLYRNNPYVINSFSTAPRPESPNDIAYAVNIDAKRYYETSQINPLVELPIAGLIEYPKVRELGGFTLLQ